MRNTLVYLILFAALGFGVWYFLIRDEDSFSSSEAGFTITDTASVSKIFLSRQGENVTLTRTDTGWVLNGKYPALRAPVNSLLEAFYKQAAVAPVSNAAHNEVLKALAAEGTKVEVYNRSGGVMRTFYVGGETNNYNGTYMLMEGAKKPYIVEIQGFEGFLTPRYSYNFYDWRDRTVFNAAAADIRSVSMQYPNDSDRSFVIQSQPNAAPVVLPQEPGAKQETKRVVDYLDFFRNVNCESYVNGTYGLDSIMRISRPKCAIALTTGRGTRQVDIYRMPITQRSKSSQEINGIEFDVERYYAVLDRRDTVVIQEQAFKKIFQERRIFFGPVPL
jgi:hypothetical protein